MGIIPKGGICSLQTDLVVTSLSTRAETVIGPWIYDACVDSRIASSIS